MSTTRVIIVPRSEQKFVLYETTQRFNNALKTG